MSDIKLTLAKRELTGKKLKSLRADGLIPSVVYGGENAPITTQSPYNETEKALLTAGYHSPVDLTIDGKNTMAIVKDVALDPVTRKIINVEFQAIKADQAVEATTPIVLIGFEESEANKLHFAVNQSMDEIDVKAKPADLPKELTINIAHMADINDKVIVADLQLPAGVELADKELDAEQVIASLYDPAAEAAQREAEEAAAKAAEAEAAAAEGAAAEGEGEAKPEEAAEGEKPEEAKAE